MKSVKIYKLLKELPNQTIGAFLYKNENKYEFFDGIKYQLDDYIVENNKDWFEPIQIEWNIGDVLYYVNTVGTVVSEEFYPARHLALIFSKNCFKHEEDAIWYKNSIERIREGNDVLVSKNELKDMFSCSDIKEIKKIIKKYI